MEKTGKSCFAVSKAERLFLLWSLFGLSYYNTPGVMAEDADTPELRNPPHSGMRKESRLRRLMQKLSK